MQKINHNLYLYSSGEYEFTKSVTVKLSNANVDVTINATFLVRREILLRGDIIYNNQRSEHLILQPYRANNDSSNTYHVERIFGIWIVKRTDGTFGEQ